MFEVDIRQTKLSTQYVLTSSSSSLTRRTTSVDLGLIRLWEDRDLVVDAEFSSSRSVSRNPSSTQLSLPASEVGGSIAFDDEEQGGSHGEALGDELHWRGTSGSTLVDWNWFMQKVGEKIQSFYLTLLSQHQIDNTFEHRKSTPNSPFHWYPSLHPSKDSHWI